MHTCHYVYSGMPAGCSIASTGLFPAQLSNFLAALRNSRCVCTFCSTVLRIAPQTPSGCDDPTATTRRHCAPSYPQGGHSAHCAVQRKSLGMPKQPAIYHYLTRSMVCAHDDSELMPHIAAIDRLSWVISLDRTMSSIDIEDQLDEMYDRNLNALLDSLIPAYVVTYSQAMLWDQLMAESMSTPDSPLRRPCDDSLDERFRILVQDINSGTDAFRNHRKFPYDRVDLLAGCPEYCAAHILRYYCDEQFCLICRDVLRWLRSHDCEPAPAPQEPLPPKTAEHENPSESLGSDLAPPFQLSAPESHMSAPDATAGGGSARQFNFLLGSDSTTAPGSPHNGAHSLAADVPDAPASSGTGANTGYAEDSAASSLTVSVDHAYTPKYPCPRAAAEDWLRCIILLG
jgi:hypothetical protein